ncbi:hypothetical protein [Pedobacter sp.]|uniref:hypothetical protein n=1 Tax=Pedobacter sp. TaxID=1411316 RepID=UPI00396CED7A
MMKQEEKMYNIPAFLKYLNVENAKSDVLHVVNYEHHNQIPLRSEPVSIDFYVLAIKTNSDITPAENRSASYAYLDCPTNSLEWNYSSKFSGYAMFITPKLFDKYAKEYNFKHYNNHEALFLTLEEEETLQDLFKKSFKEYQKENFSKEVIVSYASLILSYIQLF